MAISRKRNNCVFTSPGDAQIFSVDELPEAESLSASDHQAAVIVSWRRCSLWQL